MPDLETQLRKYAVRLDESYPDVLAKEIIEGGPPIIMISPVPEASRARRSLLGLVAGLGLVAVLVGAVLFLTKGRAPTASEGSTEPAVMGMSGHLGIFESVRGKILFNSGVTDGTIQVVDPTKPGSQMDFDFDFQLEGALIPTGWSADGSILAITDEYHGARYVVDQTGRAKPLTQGSCCRFADSNWLSPDGAHSAAAFSGEGKAPGHLAVIDLDDLQPNDTYELEPFLWVSGTVWSPDGSQIALVASRDGGEFGEPTVHIVDLESGATRDLLANELGHIRNLAWSPQGDQILVIAGEQRNPRGLSGLNSYVNAIPTSIYLVNLDGSEQELIADGHYVAASWSPDGTQIATIDFDGRRRVMVMNADGSDERAVAEMPGSELFSGLAWHPVP